MSASRQPGVVITGIGVVSPFGVGRERYWDHVHRGVSGSRAITQFDVSSSPCRVAAWVPPVSIDDAPAIDGDDDEGRHTDPKRYSRAALFGVIAAREAWRDAGLRAGEPDAGCEDAQPDSRKPHTPQGTPLYALHGVLILIKNVFIAMVYRLFRTSSIFLLILTQVCR